MNTIEYNNIIDKLAIQVNSIQEGFSILSKSANIKELAIFFSRILRGNFLLNDVNIFSRKNSITDWEIVLVPNQKSLNYISNLQTASTFTTEYLDDEEFSLLASLRLIDGSYWGLVVGKKIDKSGFSEFDKIIFQMFLQMLDNAYQSFLNHSKEKQLNFSLNHRVVQLNSLIDTGIEISKLHKTSSLVELSLGRAVALTNASSGVLQISRENELLESISFPGNAEINRILCCGKKIDTSVEFKGIKYLFTLAEKESRQGIIDFDSTDEILLAAFARQVLTAIENEHLHSEAIEKERMHREIEMAAAIQRRIIPQKLPEIQGYDLAGINIPSLEIGGDYYDVTKLTDGRYLLIISDVSGKGVASGLLVNTLNASLNAYIEKEFILTEVADRLNKVIFKASTPEKYITGFIAILEPSTGQIEYLNAGHNPIYYFTNGEIKKLDKGGFAFGMLDFGLPYESVKLQMKCGDKILFYTDGITEAMNENDDEYSDEKLESFFLNHAPVDAEIFIKELIMDVKKHTADTPQSDDITALYLSRV